MNLQQFRFLREAARHKFSLTEAARALHTSQPGISKAIIDLEAELGVPIFARHGKRVKGLTAPGQMVLDAAERIMQDVDNLQKLARDYAGSPEGTLRVGDDAYAGALRAADRRADVRCQVPASQAEAAAGQPAADCGDVDPWPGRHRDGDRVAADHHGLLSIPVYDWQHVAIIPPGHPLAKFVTTPGKLTLKDLARHPLITYEQQFAGRSKIDAAFEAAGIVPSIVLKRSTPT